MIDEEKNETVTHLYKPRKPYVFTNVLSKLILMHTGKKDGKRGIPTDINNPEWLSPTLRKEYSKIDEKMSKIWYDVDKTSDKLYAEIELLLSDFLYNEKEINNIYNYIMDENVTYKEVVGNSVTSPALNDMLNAKRHNEGKCDALGIRLRRYNEHKKVIDVAMKAFDEKKNNLKNDYQKIMENYQIIINTENKLDIYFWELCSNIERRTSWYWQGMLLKHLQGKIMPQIPPKANNNHINTFHQNRRNALEQKILDIEKRYQNILNVRYIEGEK